MARRPSDAPPPTIEAGNKGLPYKPRSRPTRKALQPVASALGLFPCRAAQMETFINSCIRDL